MRLWGKQKDERGAATGMGVLPGLDAQRAESPAPDPRIAGGAGAARPASSPLFAANGGVQPRAPLKFGEVPEVTRILTGIDKANGFRVTPETETLVIAVEVAPKEALILYSAEPIVIQRIGAILKSIRSELVTNGYNLRDGRELPAEADVIPGILASVRGEKSRNGLSDDAQGRKLWDKWLNQAAEMNATDIHFKVNGQSADIQVRVDGEMELLDQAPATNVEMAVAWAYNMAGGRGANSDSQFSHTENQYTTIQQTLAGKRHLLRFQSQRGHSGPKIVCRLLVTDPNARSRTLEDIGFERSQVAIFEGGYRRNRGLLLFTGVTGSGKSTAQKAYIEGHPLNGRMAVTSIEDPVEYPLKNVHQVQVQRDIADPEASRLAYIKEVVTAMRMDPDGLILQEIRDQATASAALQIALTGHFCMGTLHCDRISGVVPRLTDPEIGLHRTVLTTPGTLSVLTFMALVPLLCECAISASMFPQAHPDYEEVRYTHEALRSRTRLDVDRFRYRNPNGCRLCGGRGTMGLTAVAEVFSPDDDWLDLIAAGEDRKALRYYQSLSDGDPTSSNMRGKTVFEHALLKAYRGVIDPRKAASFTDIESLPAPKTELKVA